MKECPVFSPNLNDAWPSTKYSLDILPLEYACGGIGDYRTAAFSAMMPDGSSSVDLRYESFEIKAGKYRIKGLPASYEDEDGEAQTLEITLKDYAAYSFYVAEI
ncbi:MAG: hypothetical protein IKV88_09235 [Clostridia bacterium]|nr:hypothetical protein [Clostridia bacterium]